MLTGSEVRPYLIAFQSSPDPEVGCNAHIYVSSHFIETVSILTRPGGRVQYFGLGISGGTGPGFNPHPTRRSGAMTQ